MIFQTLSNKNKGFSLIEVFIVLSIASILTFFSVTTYKNFRSQSGLNIAVGSVVEALRLAKNNAEQVNSDSKWGVYFYNDGLVVFSGSSYASRDSSKDKDLAFPGGITAGGLSEIVFEKLTGETSNIGSITVSDNDSTVNVSINEKGTITY